MKSKKIIILPKYEVLFEEIGQNLKLARKRRKISGEQASERAGIHRTTLCRIESGDYSVSIGTYFNVARVYNLHNDFLKLAEDDVFGRKLQDIELLTNDKLVTDLSKEIYKLRNKIYVAIKRGSYSNKSELYEIIGCSYEDLIKYLNENEYGFNVNDINVDIDHIIPLSEANNIDELYKLNNYKNLQLLPSYYNRNVKGDKKWDKDDFDKWMKFF